MVKKRGLGKSLDALLAYTNTENISVREQTAGPSTNAAEQFCQLAIDRIQPGEYQPRREIDSQGLEELANSIRAQGVIQPIVVRAIADDRYEIVAGERRFRAAQLAGLTEIPTLIRDIPDESAIAIALIENIQRENLNPIEEAIALQKLLDEFHLTHQQMADAIGKSRTTVTNLLRLLVLPEGVKNLVQQKLLEMGHVRALLGLPESLQMRTAELAAAKNLSVRETEEWVRRLQAADPEKAKKTPDPDIQRLQERLSRHLSLPVKIHHQAKGKGRLTIHYKNVAELEEILAQLEVTN